jgi:hypothetical protein
VTRTARLLGGRGVPGGGLPLPEIFREVLTALQEGPRHEGILHKVIRQRAEFKELRILDLWGSWDAFCDDILGALQDSGHITSPEYQHRALTPKAVPGKRLCILRDKDNGDRRMFATFHEKGERQAREAIAEALTAIGEFAFSLDPDLHPALAGAHDRARQISHLLAAALRDPGEGEGRRDRPLGGQNEWYREWVRTAGWHTTHSAMLAWNELYPEMPIARTSRAGFRYVTRVMMRDGMLETRPAPRSDGRAGGAEYRWRG